MKWLQHTLVLLLLICVAAVVHAQPTTRLQADIALRWEIERNLLPPEAPNERSKARFTLDNRSPKALPATGWLWFFYTAYAETTGMDAAEEGSWAVVWADPPRDSLSPSWQPPDFDLDASYPAFVLAPSAEWTMPCANVAAVTRLGLDRDEAVAYEQMERVLSSYNDDDGGAVRLLGYPALFQNVDPETEVEAIASHGGTGGQCQR